jgi:hypothetical protein
MKTKLHYVRNSLDIVIVMLSEALPVSSYISCQYFVEDLEYCTISANELYFLLFCLN